MKNKWFLALKHRTNDPFDLSGLKRWETPDTQYEADPFLFKYKNKNYLFYELYDYKKGRIAYSEIKGLDISEPKIILDYPWHLSYPAIFQENNEIYIIPESGTERNIQLFKATEFPDKWNLESIIWDDGNFSDSNILYYKDKWWLFTIGGNDNNLIILQANFLFGKWQKVFEKEIPNSRGAGNIFQQNGDLIRPCQDVSKIYGGAIIFKKITLPDYTEKIVRRIEPDWSLNLTGTHTFNFNQDYIVLDGKIQVND